jgi:tRNA (5-methylaminomethyl-2-thiouridylate)-methyltransferase
VKVAVLLSGGVDSSVALRLLLEQGHRPTAFYLKVWLADDPLRFGDCPWEEDVRFAEAVCRGLGVPLQVLPIQMEYRERVVACALEELHAGFTPSPDLFCNQRIKFGAFLERIGPEFQRVATGHYARLEGQGPDLRLLASPDPVKDQTYFLAHLDREQLGRALFPLGDLTKPQVRELARGWDLPTQSRPDSQGICFLGRIDYRGFLRYFLGTQAGPIVELGSGRILGEHPGHWFFTIGQRAGLGLAGGPWYVAAKEPLGNTVRVTHRLHLAEQAQDRYRVGPAHWIGGPPLPGRQLAVKLRHGPATIPATARPVAEGNWEVSLERGDPGIAPGQFTVFYDGETCLGCARVLPQSGEAAGWGADQGCARVLPQSAKAAYRVAAFYGSS